MISGPRYRPSPFYPGKSMIDTDLPFGNQTGTGLFSTQKRSDNHISDTSRDMFRYVSPKSLQPEYDPDPNCPLHPKGSQLTQAPRNYNISEAQLGASRSS